MNPGTSQVLGAVKKVENPCAETTEHRIKTLFSDEKGRLFSKPLAYSKHISGDWILDCQTIDSVGQHLIDV